jgi:uncharacterized protein (DUF1015 family)
MVEIKEFCAIRYNKEKVKKLGIEFENLVCPPYDVISDQMYKMLAKHKYNFVHFELPFGIKNLGNKKYDKVKKVLTLWKKNKIFVQDNIPAIYVYEHTFCYPPATSVQATFDKKSKTVKPLTSEVKKYVRTGLFCITKIDPQYETILPHEQTKPKPIEDRLHLLETLNMQTSPVFCLVEDDKKVLNKTLEKIVTNTTPTVVFNDNLGGVHKFYKVVSKEKIGFIKKFFLDKKLFIADGHHRYKTACEYLNRLHSLPATGHKLKIKNKQIIENAEYFMTYICPLSDDGLLILPTHRAVVGKYIKDYIDKFFDLLPWDGKSKIELGLYHNGEFKIMVPKKIVANSKLKVEIMKIPYVLLNETVLKDIPKEQIFYHQEIQEVICWAQKYGGYAFLLPPLSKDKFKFVVENKFLLPPKTTYFYPKVISGLCAYSLI